MSWGVIVYPSARESGNKWTPKPMKFIVNFGENRRIRHKKLRVNSLKIFEKSS